MIAPALRLCPANETRLSIGSRGGNLGVRRRRHAFDPIRWLAHGYEARDVKCSVTVIPPSSRRRPGTHPPRPLVCCMMADGIRIEERWRLWVLTFVRTRT